jgi:hypothetical protein
MDSGKACPCSRLASATYRERYRAEMYARPYRGKEGNTLTQPVCGHLNTMTGVHAVHFRHQSRKSPHPRAVPSPSGAHMCMCAQCVIRACVLLRPSPHRPQLHPAPPHLCFDFRCKCTGKENERHTSHPKQWDISDTNERRESTVAQHRGLVEHHQQARTRSPVVQFHMVRMRSRGCEARVNRARAASKSGYRAATASWFTGHSHHPSQPSMAIAGNVASADMSHCRWSAA